MKKNNKGMTLVEVLLTVAILTTASLMLFTCLANVIHFMSESNSIKNASDSMLAFVEGESGESVSDVVSSNKSNISYTLTSGSQSVVVNEELNEYNSNKYTELFLRSFTPRVISSDPNGDFNDDIFTVGGDLIRLQKDNDIKGIENEEILEYKLSVEINKGKFVNYEGKTYRKLTDTKNTSGKYPDSDKDNWREVNKEYIQGNYYFKDEIVTYDGNYIQAKAEGKAEFKIPSSDKWIRRSSKGTYYESALEILHDGNDKLQAGVELKTSIKHTHLSNEPASK